MVVALQTDGRAGPVAGGLAHEQNDEGITRSAARGLHDGVDAPVGIGFQVHVVVRHVRARKGRLAAPVGIRTRIEVDGEVVGVVRLVAPEDADLPVERDDGGDVVAVEGRLGPGDARRERNTPRGVVAPRAADARVHGECRSLFPGGPELPGRVLRDRERLGLVVADLDGEAGVQGVAVRARAVAVAVQPRGRAGGRPVRKDAGGDVELIGAGIPQRVGTRAAAVVDRCSRVHPGLVGEIQAEDVVRRGARRPHACPPEAVVPPQLALRLLTSERVLGPDGGRPLEPDIAVGGLGRGGPKPRHGNEGDQPRQAETERVWEGPLGARESSRGRRSSFEAAEVSRSLNTSGPGDQATASNPSPRGASSR